MKKLLFIGNSHTYVEDLPWLFQCVCKQKNTEVQVFMITYPGVDWNWHLNNHCTMSNIKFGGYDFVVMQQKSHPFDGAETLLNQGKQLFYAVESANAKAVFTSTWSEKNNPKGQDIIDNAFFQLHKNCKGSIIAKCGSGWHVLRDRIDLYAEDGEHQNQKGAYLNACILAKSIFDINPLALPKQLFFDNKFINISEADIKMLQEAASNV